VSRRQEVVPHVCSGDPNPLSDAEREEFRAAVARHRAWRTNISVQTAALSHFGCCRRMRAEAAGETWEAFA